MLERKINLDYVITMFTEKLLPSALSILIMAVPAEGCRRLMVNTFGGMNYNVEGCVTDISLQIPDGEYDFNFWNEVTIKNVLVEGGQESLEEMMVRYDISQNMPVEVDKCYKFKVENCYEWLISNKPNILKVEKLERN